MPFGSSSLAIKAIGILLLVLAVAGAVGGFIMHERAIGAEHAKEAQHNADMAWLKRAQDEAQQNLAKYEALATALKQSEDSRAAQQGQIGKLSAANDSHPCLDAAASDRLFELAPLNGGVPAAAQQRRRPAARRSGH